MAPVIHYWPIEDSTIFFEFNPRTLLHRTERRIARMERRQLDEWETYLLGSLRLFSNDLKKAGAAKRSILKAAGMKGSLGCFLHKEMHAGAFRRAYCPFCAKFYWRKAVKHRAWHHPGIRMTGHRGTHGDSGGCEIACPRKHGLVAEQWVS